MSRNGQGHTSNFQPNHNHSTGVMTCSQPLPTETSDYNSISANPSALVSQCCLRHQLGFPLEKVTYDVLKYVHSRTLTDRNLTRHHSTKGSKYVTIFTSFMNHVRILCYWLVNVLAFVCRLRVQKSTFPDHQGLPKSDSTG